MQVHHCKQSPLSLQAYRMPTGAMRRFGGFFFSVCIYALINLYHHITYLPSVGGEGMPFVSRGDGYL